MGFNSKAFPSEKPPPFTSVWHLCRTNGSFYLHVLSKRFFLPPISQFWHWPNAPFILRCPGERFWTSLLILSWKSQHQHMGKKVWWGLASSWWCTWPDLKLSCGCFHVACNESIPRLGSSCCLANTEPSLCMFFPNLLKGFIIAPAIHWFQESREYAQVAHHNCHISAVFVTIMNICVNDFIKSDIRYRDLLPFMNTYQSCFCWCI